MFFGGIDGFLRYDFGHHIFKKVAPSCWPQSFKHVLGIFILGPICILNVSKDILSYSQGSGDTRTILVIGIITNILNLRNVPSDTQQIAKGAIIIFAVAIQQLRRR